MAIFVKEYDWMWNELELSPAECRVYAYIYGLTNAKHSKAKGYNGSVRQLAKDLGLSLGATSTALTKMQASQQLQLNDGVYTSVQNMNESVQKMNGSVQNMNGSVQKMNESVQQMNSPHTPLYIESQKKDIIKAYQKDRRHGGGEVDKDSLALFTQYYQLFPYKAAKVAIKVTAQNEFVALPRETQQAIIDRLRRQLANGTPLSDTSPLLYIRNFDPCAPPPDEPPKIAKPTNYNQSGGTPPPDAQPAMYDGEWGMYSQADIRKYNLTTKAKQ